MERAKLTPDRIRKFICPSEKTHVFLWDTEAPRLAVRATRGAKSYILEAELNRQTIRITLGNTRRSPIAVPSAQWPIRARQ